MNFGSRISVVLLWILIHFGSLALIVMSAFGLGRLFLKRQRFSSAVERFVFSVVLGFGIAGVLLFVLGVCGALYRPLLVALTALGAIATAVTLLRSGARVSRRPNYSVSRPLAAIAIGFWSLLLLSSLYPPVQWDAIGHHLVIARTFLTEHRPVVVPGVQQPVLPALNHFLFTWAFALSDDILAQMVEHTFLMLTALGLYSFERRAGRPLAGFAAAAFWLAHPLVRWVGEAGYVDIACAAFVFLGVYALRLFIDEEETSWWFLAMALLAMAAGTKLPGLFFLGLGALVAPWVLWRRSGSALRWSSVWLGWAAAFGLLLPWYGFIAFHTGNPLWPLVAQYSRGIWRAPWVIEGLRAWAVNFPPRHGILDFFTLPIDWIRSPQTFFGEMDLTLSPLIVLWPIAWLIAIFDRSVRFWTGWSLAYTVFWFTQRHQLRYWLLALPMVALALLESLHWIALRIIQSRRARQICWITAGLAILLWSGWRVAQTLRDRGVPPMTVGQRERWLSAFAPGYDAVSYINRRAAPGDRACLVAAGWLNYYLKPRTIDLRSALYQNRQPTFRWPADQVWSQWLEAQKIGWILVYVKDPGLDIPKQNPVAHPFWPDYEIVYADPLFWVFRRGPVPPDV